MVTLIDTRFNIGNYRGCAFYLEHGNLKRKKENHKKYIHINAWFV